MKLLVAGMWCVVIVVACVVCCVAVPICKAADAVIEIWDGGRQ